MKSNGGRISKDERTCKRFPVAALTSQCTAFQATRGMAVIGTFISILGVVCLFVALCVASRLFALVGGILATITGIVNMVTFAVFLGAVVNAQKLRPDVATPGYSYILLIASWVVALVAAMLAYLGAFAGSLSQSDDSADFESN